MAMCKVAFIKRGRGSTIAKIKIGFLKSDCSYNGWITKGLHVDALPTSGVWQENLWKMKIKWQKV